MNENDLFESQWIKNIYDNSSNEEMLLTKIKNQIIERYHVEKMIAANMALEIVEMLNFFDVSSQMLEDYILQ